jgi:L-phenylalanine/L-methionine N-acetyltransferase
MPIEIEQQRTDVATPAHGRLISGLTIRVREPEDCAAVAEMMSLPKVIWGTHWMPFAGREQARQWIASTPEGSIQTVALLDGKLVGTAGIIALKGRRNHVGAIWMAVHDEFQNRGIGTALLAALIDAADNWLNLRRLELTVYVDNAAGVALYKKFGFQIEGTRRHDTFRGGAFVDAYAMARLKEQ